MEKIKGFLLRLLVQSWCSQVFMGSFVRLFHWSVASATKGLFKHMPEEQLTKQLPRKKGK